MTYAEKLRDPRWQKKRLEVFERDGWRCVICYSEDKELQVHHCFYGHYQPWDAPLDELQTTCRECHEMVETMVKIIRGNPSHIVAAILKLLPVFGRVPSFMVMYPEAVKLHDQYRVRGAALKAAENSAVGL